MLNCFVFTKILSSIIVFNISKVVIVIVKSQNTMISEGSCD